MNTEIFSIVIALIFGIPGLITFFRIKQTKIVYLEKHILNLKDDLLKNFGELSIKYRDIEIQNNIYFVNGFLVCQGNKDINYENNNIEIYVPDKSRWLDFKVVSNSKGMKLKRKIDQNKVELNFDLFKSKEYVEYEGIIEMDNETQTKGIYSLLNFHHRIPNIPIINKFDIESLKASLSILIISFLFALMPIYAAYDYHNIDSYELKTFNANTDKELNVFVLWTNNSLNKLHQKISNEYSGFEFLFKDRTEIFPVEIIDYNEKINSPVTSIYFKIETWNIFNWIISIFFLILFVLSIGMIIKSSVLFYYQKKYLNLIKK